MSPEILYELRGVRKAYDEGRVEALRGIDFTVHAGEFVSLIGPSGSGKTTLLQLLGAMDQPTEGMLLFRGESLVDSWDASRYRATEIGFVFQSFNLLPTFTVLENVQLPMFESSRPRREWERHATDLLDSVGLAKRASHLPSELSGGERQRVAIARSLANDPKVLLADEPTGNLDSKNAAQILEILAGLHLRRRMTLLLVTHDMGVARRATRTIQMRDGVVCYDGAPGAIPGVLP